MNVKNAKDAKQGLLALAKVVENGEVVNQEDLAVLEETEGSSTTSVVLWSIGGLLLVGGASYLGWKAYKKAKESNEKEDKESEEFLKQFKALNDSVTESNKVMATAINNVAEVLKKLNELQPPAVEENKPSKTKEDPKEEEQPKAKVVVVNSPEEALKIAEAEAAKLQKKANKLGAGPKKVKAQAEAKAAVEKVEALRKIFEEQKQQSEKTEEESEE